MSTVIENKQNYFKKSILSNLKKIHEIGERGSVWMFRGSLSKIQVPAGYSFYLLENKNYTYPFLPFQTTPYELLNLYLW